MAVMPLTASFISRLVVRIQEDKDRRVVVFASSAVGSCVSETVIVFLLLPGCFRQTDGVVASATTRLLLGWRCRWLRGGRGRRYPRSVDALCRLALGGGRWPLEPLRQVPVPVAEQLHRRGQQDGPDDRRIEEYG